MKARARTVSGAVCVALLALVGNGCSGGAGEAPAGAGCKNVLGGDKLLVGASMEDATASSAPFDVRYMYIAGGLFDGATACTSCSSGCVSNGKSCSHQNGADGCDWWGCFQGDETPPGDYVRAFVAKSVAAKQTPMLTYYEVLQASGTAEGPDEVAIVNDAAFAKRYLADWTFLVKQLGSGAALLHIEPDFWGYAQQKNPDPHALPAAVTQAPECAGFENSIAGLGKCMIHIARTYAPSAKVGLHASSFGSSQDLWTDASVDAAAEERKIAAFLRECGAADGDFVATDVSDRDAGFRKKPSTFTFGAADTPATLGSYARYFDALKALGDALKKAVVVWQIPVGNDKQDNTCDHYEDNVVDTFFAHTDLAARAHASTLLFGAGAKCQTTPESDGGNLVSKVKAYKASGAQKMCP